MLIDISPIKLKNYAEKFLASPLYVSVNIFLGNILVDF